MIPLTSIRWFYPQTFHCRVPSTADTGCCALEIGKCQPQYRTQQHKLTQQRLIWTPTRLNYCTHAVKTKRGNYNARDQKKKGAKTNHKRNKLKAKRKLHIIGWNLRLILFKGLKKLQRYVTPKKIKLLWKLQCCSVDLLTPTPQKLKGRSLIRVQFTCTVVKPVKKHGNG